jgi:hypothetical protein
MNLKEILFFDLCVSVLWGSLITRLGLETGLGDKHTQNELKELGSRSVVVFGNTYWLDLRTWVIPTFIGFLNFYFFGNRHLVAYLKSYISSMRDDD